MCEDRQGEIGPDNNYLDSKIYSSTLDATYLFGYQDTDNPPTMLRWRHLDLGDVF